MRPARAKALIINAFALAGRFAIFNPYTQGAALGYVLFGARSEERRVGKECTG